MPKAVPPLATSAAIGPQASALGVTIGLTKLREVLDAFAQAGMPFALEDAVLRAAGNALRDVPGADGLVGGAVALEHERRQLVFADISKGSLGPARGRRLAAIEARLPNAGLQEIRFTRQVSSGSVNLRLRLAVYRRPATRQP